MSALSDQLLEQIAILGLPTPQTEVVFARPRRWRFDFAWEAHKLACEVDGGTWTGGRHTTGTGIEHDAEKYSEAAIRGWRVLRVTGNMVRDGRALALVERALRGA